MPGAVRGVPANATGSLMVSATPSSARPRRVAVHASTGAIGTSALPVARHRPDRLELVGLAAPSKWEQLADQCRALKPRLAVLTDPDAFKQADRAFFPRETELLAG